MKTWDDRVVEAVQAQRARDDANKQWFIDLGRYLDTPSARRDAERLSRDGDLLTKLYKGEVVFSCKVADGQTIIMPVGGSAETYADREAALDRMAALVAQAVNDPHWAESAEDRQARSGHRPLYPV
jgi:hypothetical protein